MSTSTPHLPKPYCTGGILVTRSHELIMLKTLEYSTMFSVAIPAGASNVYTNKLLPVIKSPPSAINLSAKTLAIPPAREYPVSHILVVLSSPVISVT